MGAGLGGGSSDAAYVLKGLNDLFALNISEKELEELAAILGSDCAFFIKGGAQLSEGRGELLQPISLNLSGMFLKLIYPDVHIGTAEAYANVEFDEDCSGYDRLTERDFSGLRNSFEHHVFEKFPALSAMKRQLIDEGAYYAAMSGSGSTIFGLFYEKPNAEASPNTWVLSL